MNISNLTFIVTEDCNFNCSYCFQEKEKTYIDETTIASAVDFFYPFLDETAPVQIAFYGGEPLLAYHQIKTIVKRFKQKQTAAAAFSRTHSGDNQSAASSGSHSGAEGAGTGKGKEGRKTIQWVLTTNGALLSDEMLAFFDREAFSLTLSYDGLAHDDERQKGSAVKMRRLLERLAQYPGIEWDINAVFTPQTVHLLVQSLRSMIEEGASNITFNLATQEQWDSRQLETLREQLSRLCHFLAVHYRDTGRLPVSNFSSRNGGVFRCSAGTGNMAVSPRGDVWGCFLFHDYFKKRKEHPQYGDFYFGPLERFKANYPVSYDSVAGNYRDLSQDYFRVDEEHCFLCDQLQDCVTCPLMAAYSSDSVGVVSCNNCTLNKLQAAARNDFLQRIAENVS